MKKLVSSLVLSLLVLLLALPLTAFADETVPNVTGEFNLVETNQKIEEGQVYKEEQPVYSEQYLLVEEDKNGNMPPSSRATIGGYGTINCFDGGLQIAVCNVSFKLTGGAQIMGVEATVTTFDASNRQWGTEPISVWLSGTGTLYSTFNTQTEEPLYSAGKYYARVTGAIGGISGTEGEKTYIIVPLKSAEFTIK
ncbi:hypothetical protein [Paenibacillus sp. IHBB 10380]|uniref:hypothetical protein n=1 Tax=Paenibacillus sp. IHBB 10380 TaxID=1566358 RepID=UPI0005CFE9E2|nr:hypothetical protein [Paenibacillus sp. IHBB 10380]AJS59247.1 hypothetical protein UB51_13100 [Paenibacillus sp. IHBB 10380]